jgi:DegV family protein with EDD domain
MPRIGIVCDSTCDLAPAWLAERDVAMVPLKVLFGDESYLDWIDLTPQEFYAKMTSSPILPKTSQPSPADFAEVYRRLADQGCEGIVVITLSAALSGTFESATMAVADSPVPVRVVDGKNASQATALLVKAAIAARDAGGGIDEIEKAALDLVPDVHLYFVVDTMEYLVKGGRAGKAAGLAASLLNIKPVLHIDRDGVIEAFKKVKGMRNAVDELAAQVARDSRDTPMLLTFLSGGRPELVTMMRDALDAAGAAYVEESEGLVGAVIGTYTGPQVIGVAYHPAAG